MAGFELRISEFRGDRSTTCATTIVQFRLYSSAKILCKIIVVVG